MPKLLIFDAFTLLIREKTVANYTLLRCKSFSLKIWVCKIFDKFHVCTEAGIELGHFINIWSVLSIFGDILFIFGADNLLRHFINIWGHIISFCEETFYWEILFWDILSIFGGHFISNILWSFQ